MDKEIPFSDEESFDIIMNLYGKALYLPHGEYRFLSLRCVSMTEDALKPSSLIFLISNDRFWKIDVAGNIRFFQLDSASDFLQQIRSLIFSLRSAFVSFSDQVDLLEDQLLEGSSTRYFHSTWFFLKKEISVMERAFSRNITALNDFLLDYQLPKAEMKLAQSVLTHLNSDLRSSQGDLQKLDSAHQYMTALKAEKLNKNLYLLSLVSGVFLPLNLIVGFFGINTENLFFSGDPDGTWYVFAILAAIFILLITGLPVLQFIDHLILRKLIGRNDIYQKIQRKIGSLVNGSGDENEIKAQSKFSGK